MPRSLAGREWRPRSDAGQEPRRFVFLSGPGSGKCYSHAMGQIQTTKTATRHSIDASRTSIRLSALSVAMSLILAACGGPDGSMSRQQASEEGEQTSDDGGRISDDSNSASSDGKRSLSESDLGSPCDADGETASIPNGTGICAADGSGALVWQKMGKNGGADGDSKQPKNFMANWDIWSDQPREPKCTTSTPLSVTPTPVNLIKFMNPLGYSQPGAHALPVPHHNVYVAEQASVDENGIARRTALVDPIVAPSNATLVGLARNVYVGKTPSGGSATYDEYMLSLHVCGTIYVVFNHIDDVPQAWLDAVKAEGVREECNQGQDEAEVCMWSYLEIPVKAGDRLGRASGYAHGWDIGATDVSKPMEHRLDPSAWSPRWASAICALDLFEPKLREQLYGTLVGSGNCGRADFDIANSLSGVWLAIGQRERANQEDLHIGLFPRYTYDGRLRFSIGNESNVVGLPSDIYEFVPEKSGLRNPEFASVKPGEVACFDGLKAKESAMSLSVTRIYASMQSDGSVETISIAGAGTGKCGAGPYTMPAQFSKFERRIG